MVYLCVPFLLVTPCKGATTYVTLERLLTLNICFPVQCLLVLAFAKVTTGATNSFCAYEILALNIYSLKRLPKQQHNCYVCIE